MNAETRSQESPPVRRQGGPDLLAILGAVCAMAVFAVLCWPLLRHRVFVEDDLAAYHLPFRAFYHACVQRGQSFLWDPCIFNGFYLHGDGQIGMLHPVHWLIYRLFPLDTAFMLDLLSSYPLAFAGMYLLLRRWKLPVSGALFGATLCAFLGFNMNHYIHMAFVAVLAHVPWALLAIDMVMRGRHPKRGGMLLLAVGASQLLLGFPQGVYYAWIIEAGYALLLAWREGRPGRLFFLGAVKVLSVFLGMVQLLPTWDVMARSFRAAPGMDMQLSVSLHPLNFLSLLNPYLFQWRYFGPIKGDEPWDAPYMGVAATVLLVYTLLAWRSLGRRRPLAAFAWGLVLFGVLSALGKYGFLYPVYAWLPLVSKFRAHARHLCIAHTGMALLAALAFSQLAEGAGHGNVISWRRLGWLLVLPLVSAGMTLGVALGRIWPEWMGQAALLHYTMPFPALILGCALLTAAALLVAAAGRGRRVALAGLVLLTCADIGLYSLRHKPQATLDAFVHEVSSPPAAEGTRVDSDIHPMFMNRFGMLGLRGVYGYTSFMPERRLDFTLEPPLRLAGVQWREARAAASPELAAAWERGEHWMPLSGGLPRARLLSEVRASQDPAGDLCSVDPAHVALTEMPLSLPAGVPGQASITKDAPGDIHVQTNALDRQVLVISESYHPGWRAWIDGSPVDVLRLYGDFIGCVVPAGTHQAMFRFEPWSYRLGKAMSLAGLALAGLFFVFLPLRGRASEAGTPSQTL